MTDVRFQRVLDGYARRMEDEQRIWSSADPRTLFARRDEFLLSVGEDVARFLHALVIARGARRILELGTSYGYSTLFLADAARRTGGTVITLELDAAKQSYARDRIGEAGLSDHMEWHCGDATALLPHLDGPYDVILIDLWKDLYIPCLELVRPKLADNAVIAADNMIEPQMSWPEAKAYRAAVRAAPELQTMLLPIGSGIELSCVWRTEPY